MKTFLKIIFLGLYTAFSFSAFIYFDEFGLTNKIINTILGINALALLLYIPKRSIPIAGFTIGILWFYWVGYSFKYYDFPYLIYVVSIMFGIVHMALFSIVALTNNVFFRAILLSLVSYIEPMAWNWIQVELLFIQSYIGVFKYQYIIVMSSLVLMSYVKQKYKSIKREPWFPLCLITSCTKKAKLFSKNYQSLLNPILNLTKYIINCTIR